MPSHFYYANLQMLTFPLTPFYLPRGAPRQRSLRAVHRPKHAGCVSVALLFLTGLLMWRIVSEYRHTGGRSFKFTSKLFFLFHRLISSHPALVNAIILVLHSVAGSMPAQSSASSSRNVSASSYSDMPGERERWRCTNRRNLRQAREGLLKVIKKCCW